MPPWWQKPLTISKLHRLHEDKRAALRCVSFLNTEDGPEEAWCRRHCRSSKGKNFSRRRAQVQRCPILPYAVYQLGIDYLKTEIIPHVYSNSKSQERFGQYHWSVFRQWIKLAMIMKYGNERACKNLASRIKNSDYFKSDPALALKRKYRITPHQLEELEDGKPCKKKV